MSIRNLEGLFRPRSVVVIGATERPGAVGGVLTTNLLSAGFAGPLYAVNPKHDVVHGVRSWPSVEALPHAPDLAVIATPAETVPCLIGALADRGTAAAIVISAGFGEGDDAAGRARLAAALDAARPRLLRIVGPNCLGVLVPGIGLNASFSHLAPKAGGLAFVTQSGAIATAVLDWAQPRAIGFSHVISMGTMADVDFGDVLEWLARDTECRGVLLYVEAVTQARKFMSAARACARLKPVIVVKAGRSEAGARAARSHTGALAGSDAVYDAAFRRAGMLRVFEVEELFAAAEALAKARPIAGDRLAILTNGGGFGVLAVDALAEAGGRLATLAPETVAALDRALPNTWSRGNPVDILGDADAQRYTAALSALLADPNADAVLVINCPTAVASSVAAADGVVQAARGATRPVLTSWVGDAVQRDARRVFAEASLPTFDTPEAAVRAFRHMVVYRQNQDALREVPRATPAPEPDRARARALIEAGRGRGESWLPPHEAREVLSCYRIPVNPALAAATPEDAARLAATLDGAVALKIDSPDIVHKSDCGGVALAVAAGDVEAAGRRMIAAVRRVHPAARLRGFTVEPMVGQDGSLEIIAGIARDPDFGPVILFGAGGTRVELLADRAIGLPPLNAPLARALMARTRIAREFAGYRGSPPIDQDSLAAVLIRLAELAVDLPEIAELDINPLLARTDGALALDARIRLQDPAKAAPPAIRSYPRELESEARLKDGTRLALRPARPEDEPLVGALFGGVSPADLHLSGLSSLESFSRALAARLTQIDYDRELALLALAGPDAAEAVGIAHLIMDPDRERAECGVIVRSDVQGRGIGYALMERLVAIARDAGVGVLFGRVQEQNRAMLELAAATGFTIAPAQPGEVTMSRRLTPPR